jgi:hypothetical protein
MQAAGLRDLIPVYAGILGSIPILFSNGTATFSAMSARPERAWWSRSLPFSCLRGALIVADDERHPILGDSGHS